MQHYLQTLAVALLLTGPALAQNTNQTPYQTKTFATNGLTTVRVETSGGSIAVEGDHAGEAKVEVYVQPNNQNGSQTLSQAELDERLSSYVITVETQGNTLVATARRKDNRNIMNWRNGVSIAFRVYVPRRMTTDLRTSGGSISLSHLASSQKFEISGGSLNMIDLDGNTQGRTSGGSINLNNCRPMVDVETSGGSVEAEMVSVGKFVRLSASSGSVRVRMPLDKGLDLDLRGNRVNVPQPLSGFSGSIEKDRVWGQLNGGGIPVVLSASSGSVSMN